VVVLLIATALIPVVTPIAFVVTAVVDVVGREPRFRRVRGVALITGLILLDFAGMVRTALIWLFSPVGRGVDRAKIQARYSATMTWWTSQIIRVISRAARLPIDCSQLDTELLAGNAIVIGRHRSLLDAVLPATILGNQGLHVRYVLKDDLQWDINIDLVGQRMGHVFVNRAPKNLNDELEPIRELARRIDQNSVGVIFPEGTFFTEKRKARAVASLRRRNDYHADLAQSMNYLLPPRPAGTLALFEGAPEADIILLGHVGFEPFGSIGKILSNLGSEHSIVIRAWRFAREQVPTDPAKQIDWLFERWVEMDRWIADHHPLAGQSSPVRALDH